MAKRRYTPKQVAERIKNPRDGAQYYRDLAIIESSAAGRAMINDDLEGEREHSKKSRIYSLLSAKSEGDENSTWKTIREMYDDRTLLFLIGILAISLALLSPNMTGNAVGSLSRATSNWLGAAVFVFGVIGGYVFLRSRK